MSIESILTTVVPITVAGVVTVSVGYYLIKNDIDKYFRLRFAGKKDERTQLFGLRLQAHERLIIFVERINPSNLLLRVYMPGISVPELQASILNEIRSEYQHNVTQQLYVSERIWNVIRKLKDDTLAMVNNGVQGLPEQATGMDLSKKVLQQMAEIPDNPYDLTLDLIKKDIHQLF
ncbi:hypothetical protein H9X96_08930 [Pedobacter sp. N36a]|uniref:DUF7935 family protein n=1 Tax=Pedobacter sp. N36a TaxID=2767996 RepID=UPI001656A7C7|nr:hypothetical protein [Pedobacter sp. N36a]MBC8985900.1 hypothetical protein [Pedobacter sp. N36a]